MLRTKNDREIMKLNSLLKTFLFKLKSQNNDDKTQAMPEAIKLFEGAIHKSN